MALDVDPGVVIATCPMIHPDIQYVSKNSVFVFGHTTDYLITHSNIDKYLTHIHDADQEDLYACMTGMITLKPFHRKNIIFTAQYFITVTGKGTGNIFIFMMKKNVESPRCR